MAHTPNKKHIYLVNIPRYGVLRYVTAYSEEQAVLYALKKLKRENPWMHIYFKAFVDDAVYYAKLALLKK